MFNTVLRQNRFVFLIIRSVSNDDQLKNLAAHILESIDENVDPCDDFYQFACGSWIRQAQIPDYSNVDPLMVFFFFDQFESFSKSLRLYNNSSNTSNQCCRW